MNAQNILNATKPVLENEKRKLEAKGYKQVNKPEEKLLEKEYITNEQYVPTDVPDDFPGYTITWTV